MDIEELMWLILDFRLDWHYVPGVVLPMLYLKRRQLAPPGTFHVGVDGVNHFAWYRIRDHDIAVLDPVLQLLYLFLGDQT